MLEKQDTKRVVAIVNASKKQQKEVASVLTHFCDVELFHGDLFSLKKISQLKPAVVMVDENVVIGDSVKFIQDLRRDKSLDDTAIIHCINSLDRALIEEGKMAGAEDHIVRPLPRNTLIDKVAHYLSRKLERSWDVLPETQKKALTQSISVFNDLSTKIAKGETTAFKQIEDSTEPLVDAIENNDFTSILDGVRDHDDYTYAHSMRVASLLTLLGHEAGFKRSEQKLLASGGLLHDVGKMKIPHHILNKPGKLTEEEFEVIKTHVPHTVDYLETVGNIPKAIFIIAEQHHEKIDGTGYPYGLKGAQLNELARMTAVVDVFSALTDRRVYKEAMPESDAITIMTEEMQQHLDQNYVKMFRSILIDAGILT